jgi:hypothetical protein
MCWQLVTRKIYSAVCRGRVSPLGLSLLSLRVLKLAFQMANERSEARVGSLKIMHIARRHSMALEHGVQFQSGTITLRHGIVDILFERGTLRLPVPFPFDWFSRLLSELLDTSEKSLRRLR